MSMHLEDLRDELALWRGRLDDLRARARNGNGAARTQLGELELRLAAAGSDFARSAAELLSGGSPEERAVTASLLAAWHELQESSRKAAHEARGAGRRAARAARE